MLNYIILYYIKLLDYIYLQYFRLIETRRTNNNVRIIQT